MPPDTSAAPLQGGPANVDDGDRGETVTTAKVRVYFSTCMGRVLVARHSRTVTELGGFICGRQDDDFTHYVTLDGKRSEGKGFIRSFKTLLALASGRPIVSDKWLAASKKQRSFCPPNEYLLEDTKAEREYSFSLRESYLRAQIRPVFEGFEVLLTPNLLKGETDSGSGLVKLVCAAGGIARTKLPIQGEFQSNKSIAFGVSSDRRWASRNLREGVPFYEREQLLAILQNQKLPTER
uniref:Mediator of dna damage checkpoint protein 1 n=1 Tax=Tetraselmis sp. GSL018 TaxID=582737 RepID=A0A061RH77_9CHLO